MDRNYELVIWEIMSSYFRNYELVFQNTFILTRSGVANFADLIKITTMFLLKQPLKTKKKNLKELGLAS